MQGYDYKRINSGEFVKEQTEKGMWHIVITLLFGIFASVLVFFWLSFVEYNKVYKEFKVATQEHVAAIEARVNAATLEVPKLAALYHASGEVGLEVFQNYTRVQLTLFPDIQALEWIPRVSHLERERFEKAARKLLPEFRITERSDTGVLQSASKRDEYFPVYLVEPLSGNEAAVGYDLASSSQRRLALEQSRDSGKLVATARISLVQKQRGQYGFLLFMPVYDKGVFPINVEQRKQYLRGFVLGVYYIHDIVERALAPLQSSGIDIQINDISAPEGLNFLYRHSSQTGKAIDSSKNDHQEENLSFAKKLSIADRTWELFCTPASGYYVIDNTLAYLLSVLIFVGTLLSIAFQANHYRRNQRIRSILDGQRKALLALRGSESRFRQLTENIHEVFWLITPDWQQILYISPAYATVWGRSCNSLLENPLSWLEAIHPDDRDKVTDYMENKVNGDLAEIDFPEYRVVRPDKSVCWVKARGYPIQDGSGEIYRIAGFAEDITQRKQDEEELRLAASVFKSCAEGIMVTSQDGTIIQVNPGYTEICGYTSMDAIGNTPRIMRSEHHDEGFYREFWDKLIATGGWTGEIWNRCKGGSVIPVWQNITSVKDDQGQVVRYVSIFTDISERKNAEERILHLAHFDVLTDLPNRLLFKERCEHAIHRAHRESKQMALLFLDLDGFKHINDSLGHPVGDQVLQIVAQRLKDLIREEDTVARLGGDEFVLILEDVSAPQDAALVAGKVLNSIDIPMHVGEQEVKIQSSIGICLYPDDGADVTTLVRNADAAMYLAKEKGRGNYQFYTTELTRLAHERVRLESQIRRAIDRGELLVYYQPQWCLLTKRLIGAEALVRWLHPEQGLVSPDKFIPISEENGLIIPLGEWVLYTACVHARAWIDAGLPVGRISVNVSGQQIQRGDIVKTVRRILHETGLDARHLELEVTENFIMQEAEHAIGVLNELKAMGITIAIDDFGTGYSSLSYLRSLPIDKLKIDQSFVRDIPADPDAESIAKAIIALSKSLQLKVIAEGVETGEQEAFLIDAGCEEVQGYLYSKPVPERQFSEILANSSRSPLVGL